MYAFHPLTPISCSGFKHEVNKVVQLTQFLKSKVLKFNLKFNFQESEAEIEEEVDLLMSRCVFALP